MLPLKLSVSYIQGLFPPSFPPCYLTQTPEACRRGLDRRTGGVWEQDRWKWKKVCLYEATQSKLVSFSFSFLLSRGSPLSMVIRLLFLFFCQYSFIIQTLSQTISLGTISQHWDLRHRHTLRTLGTVLSFFTRLCHYVNFLPFENSKACH